MRRNRKEQQNHKKPPLAAVVVKTKEPTAHPTPHDDKNEQIEEGANSSRMGAAQGKEQRPRASRQKGREESENKNSVAGAAAAAAAFTTAPTTTSATATTTAIVAQKPRSFYESLVRERDLGESVWDYYTVIECIGRGGLSHVYQIEKKRDKIGGSSRAVNVRTQCVGGGGGGLSTTKDRSSSSSNSSSSSSRHDRRRRRRATTAPTTARLFQEPSFLSRRRRSVTPPSRRSSQPEPPLLLSPPLCNTRTTCPCAAATVAAATTRERQESSCRWRVSSRADAPPPLPHTNTTQDEPSSSRSSSGVIVPSAASSIRGGDGSFAPLRRFAHHQNGAGAAMYFALKEIDLAQVPRDKVEQLKNEVEILKALDHKNIIKAYETFYAPGPAVVADADGTMSSAHACTIKNSNNNSNNNNSNGQLFIVMELCTGGDLYSRFPYTEHRVANIVRQILSAVSYMHDRRIVHRDLKLENVVFENEHPDAIIKVIDFGLSKEYSPHQDRNLSERVGTFYSMSPETMRGDYTNQADLWSIGVVTYMLLSGGVQPFDGATPKDVVAKVLRGTFDFDGLVWTGISAAAQQFIRALLVLEPGNRPTAAAAKRHEWLVGGGGGEQNRSSHSSSSIHDSNHSNENGATREKGATAVDEEFKDRVRECMVRYAETGDFLKFALNVIAKKSTSEEIFELRTVFDEFDADDTGTLDMSEFKAALGQFKMYSEEDIEEMFHKIDVNRNNEINYTEFLAAALETQGIIEEFRLAEAFDLLDSDDTGYISRENLRQILGDQSNETYIDQLIAEADFLKDGRISYGEFLQAFNQQKQALVYSIYDSGVNKGFERSLESDDAAKDVLRRFGIIRGLRRAFNGNLNLKEKARLTRGKSR